MEFPKTRICPDCPGLKWTKDQLAEHSEHLATHNPSPSQWAEAYKRIEAGKEKAKKAS